ncbi:uncharacterized protein LOC112570854 [Pomacea canaliculata]|uniref:uncharacterized protein LOC112570854 n=1 Tax=Pomacea canaliculata TaxID=400727 RepID=UPI000D7394E1|nr:uncharacterized protein LOC112570854 [Pomacea canaliculata]XP_025105306.1 uncharacterized protein LOC112570854 [Pomacea canaliculata]XP_025105307.1 uncharacterized protein LOC112570854 [Pomacea canaliculata]XP_025105308.1 uncharacterized protein LOC112570854 [Pomacea canaliculata]
MTGLFERVDQTPRVETDGFEHLNNFIVFNNGRDVLVRGISSQESLTSNLIQCSRMPLSDSCRYYTMKVETLETDNFLMFGLTNKCLPGAPMWTVDRSVRYHSNDGGVFNGDLGIHTYHSYNEGDTVTCRLDYTGSDRSLINFMLNDCFVYRQWVNLPPDQLYATIGVSRGRAELTVEWPEPDKGDIPIKNDLPSNWFGWKGIGRDDEASTFVLANIDSTTQREAFNVQCPLALTRDFTYFEVEILRKASTTESEGHGIGLVSGNCEAFVYPGWTTNSIGYHNDDGGLYVNGDKVTVATDDDLTCKEGDRMGCGVIFPRDVQDEDMREPILVLIYFTKNGQLAHKTRMRQPRGGFFPCIAFCHIGDEIRLDVKCEPPALTSDLHPLLTTCEACADYRCTEVFLLRDLTHNSATVRLDTDHDQAQLLQYRAEPLRNLGDAFYISVTDFGVTTEIQMGVSTEGFKLEGEFLGSEPTSCGYMLKLGTVVSKDGMRAVTKWNPNENQIIGCYLDYIDDGGAVLCFTIDDRLIGRGVVARATGLNSALYASIVISAGPAEIKVNWSGILNSTTLKREQRKAEDWLRSSVIRGQNFRLERRPSEGYAFAASAQDCLPLVIGSSMFSVRLLGGKELPAVGVSRATTDVNNVLGSDSGEICFHPTSRSTLSNNENRRVANAPEIRVGTRCSVPWCSCGPLTVLNRR